MKRVTQLASSVAAIVLTLTLVFGVALPVGAAPMQNNVWHMVKAAADEAGSLAGMLGRLPDLPLGKDGALVTYADAARQAATVGVAPPRGTNDVTGQDAWIAALTQQFFPQTAEYWGSPEWREVFGFDLFQVDQAASYSAPPFSVTVVRGRFDVDESRAAWARGGYQPIDLGAGEAYAIREDFAIDIDDPGSRMALAHMNVVALTGDGELIFGSTRDAVQGALAAAAGQGPSFAERPEVAPLAQAAPADLATALIVPGAMLQAVTDPAEAMFGDESAEDFATRVAAEQAEAQRLPPVAAGLLGLTVGASAGVNGTATPAAAVPPAKIVAVLAMFGPRGASTAAAVVKDRLATQRFPERLGGDLAGRPWTEIFPERSVQVFPDASAVLIALTPAPGVPVHLLDQMIFTRTPGFLAWSP